MTQYTDNFRRVPAAYPPDMVLDNFDPYLDGGYTAPAGDAVILYLLEPKLESYFETTAVLDGLTVSRTLDAFEATRDRTPLDGAASFLFPPVSSDIIAFGGQTTTSTLEASFEAPVDQPFTVNLTRSAVMERGHELIVLTASVNIAIIQGSFEMGMILASVANGDIEATTTTSSFDGAYSATAIESITTLTD